MGRPAPGRRRARPDRYRDVDALLERTSRWVAQTGAPAGDLAELRDASMALRRFVAAGQPDLLLADGDRPEVPGWRLRALHTPGHTPGHLCFVEERTGWCSPATTSCRPSAPTSPGTLKAGPDPLADYLASLERLRPYGDALVLLGYQRRFRGLGTLRRAGRPPHRTARRGGGAGRPGRRPSGEVATRLGWSRPWAEISGIMRRAALGETAAHLTHLERRGRLEAVGDTPLRWVVRVRGRRAEQPGRRAAVVDRDGDQLGGLVAGLVSSGRRRRRSGPRSS